ncbi:hypothetical protein [Streptomyces sp. NPDC050534]|uniref:hypothetical protein n=1 Tax=Streptomyces sp. NPDC050534 TaxID=3365625 RepID=UPI0037A72734
MTGSWLRRMTAGFGLPAQDLLRAILSGPRSVEVTGTPATGLELFLNVPAREALARFAGTPLSGLTSALPSLATTHSRIADREIRKAAWYAPCAAWVTACPSCCGRAWLPGQSVLLYPQAVGHVCRRHGRWLLAHAAGSASIPLTSLPEILTAHHRHVALAQARPEAAQVVALAAAVVWSWQVQGWKAETVWQDRARRLASVTGCTPAAVMPHALLAYPETIAVARLLSNPPWRQRLRAKAATAGVAAAETMLRQEIGRRVERPWLADWLAACARIGPRQAARTDPLQGWLLKSVNGISGDALWTVNRAAARPSEYSERAGLLTDRPVRSVVEEAKAAFLTGGWDPAAVLHPPRRVP